MRQVGILAAGALFAVKNNCERLVEDHANAKLLADAVQKSPGLTLDPEPETNIVVVRVDPALGSSTAFCKQLAENGIGAMPFGPTHVRFVTHLDVSRDQIIQAGRTLEKLTSLVRS